MIDREGGTYKVFLFHMEDIFLKSPCVNDILNNMPR